MSTSDLSSSIDRSRDQVIDPVTARVAQDSAWVDIQRRTFTRWCNTFLTERLFEIKDITTDLADGIIFINLLEEISNKEVCKRYNRKPVMRAQKLENISFCFNFLKQEQIKLVGMGPEDICDGKLKLILGLIWTLILRFQINRGDQKGSAKNALLEWVRSQIPEYNIQNFTHDWQSGKAICALAEAVAPGVLDLSRLSNDSLANATYGIETAKDKMEIPSILDPTDMVNNPDEHSNMAYISFFRDYLERSKNQKAEDEILRTPIPAKCKAYGPGLEKAEAKIPTEFTIESINARNSRCPCGGHPWSVKIKDQNGADLNVNIEDHNNGLYTARYTPLTAGRLSIAVTLFDKHIPHSAFSVLVTPAVVDENLSDAFGPGLEGAQVGKEAPFTVVLKNRLGDPIGESHPIDVKVTGPHGEDIPVNKTDNGDGTFALSYLPIDEGKHHIEVTIDGKPIAKSPYDVNADFPEGEAYASKCYAEGPGLQSGNDTSDPTHFTIHTVDKHGNPINTEMDPYDVMIFSPAGDLIDPLSIDHKNDGTYVVTYHPTEPGDYEIDIVVRNPHSPLHYDHIAQSPFHVNVKPGTDAGQSWAEGEGLRDGILDTLPTTFTIHAANRDGDQMNRGGDPFEVKIVDPRGGNVPADIKDNGDGTYKVDYKPSGGPGQYKINVDLKGKAIKDAPFNINIKAGAWPAFCLVDRYTFIVQSKTAAGENKLEGGEDIKVQINGPNGPVDTVDLKDLGDGSYLVSYKLPHGDNQQEFNVSVTINNEHIKGSPWKQFY